MNMQSLYSIFSPAASASRHLAHAASTARADFATQANRTQRRVARDLDQARADASEATMRLNDVLDSALSAIRDAAAMYSDDALRRYAKHRGKKIVEASVVRRHPYLIAGSVLGISYVALRVWRTKWAQRAESSEDEGEAEDAVAVNEGASKPKKGHSRSPAGSSEHEQANGASQTRTH